MGVEEQLLILALRRGEIDNFAIPASGAYIRLIMVLICQLISILFLNISIIQTSKIGNVGSAPSVKLDVRRGLFFFFWGFVRLIMS